MLRNRIPLYSFIFFTLLIASCKKEDVAATNDYNTLGTSAHELLAATPYNKLQIEIHYMPGQDPGATATSALVNFLNTYINKPAGIQVSQQQIPASGKTELSLSEIVDLEKKYRTSFTAGNVISVHILITDGAYQASGVFATSYWNTSLCLFGKTIGESAGGPGQVSRANLVTILLEHEFGHLLGLVNQGSPMQQNHRDANHGAHCNVTSCLMYYEVETASPTGNIPVLDNNCRADLTANGGK